MGNSKIGRVTIKNADIADCGKSGLFIGNDADVLVNKIRTSGNAEHGIHVEGECDDKEDETCSRKEPSQPSLDDQIKKSSASGKSNVKNKFAAGIFSNFSVTVVAGTLAGILVIIISALYVSPWLQNIQSASQQQTQTEQ